MKKYKELYFDVDRDDLLYFTKKVVLPANWKNSIEKISITEYFTFSYLGSKAEKATIYICESHYHGSPRFKIANIVPLEKNELSISQYNDVITLFYNEVILPYLNMNSDFEVVGPTSDAFDPLEIISEIALKKLEAFCNGANKSTGSSHPSDQERWFDFICQTIDDNRFFDADTLYRFLMDEDYWGKKEKDTYCMGRFAWSEEKANELALEYESACCLLNYYKETRGLK